MSSGSPSSSSTSAINRKRLLLTKDGRTRFSPPGQSRSTNNISNFKAGSNTAILHNLVKLNQLVDNLKSLKRHISHYFDQISKQGDSVLAGDVRRVYRRILLLHVKYRRRQNFEKRRMKQPIEKSDEDDDNGDSNDNSNSSNHNSEANNANIFPTWTMKKIVSTQSLSFTRAGFDADHDGIEDFDEIALAATRDVVNIQNHCVRLIFNDHQMKLPIYGLQTQWDSQTPKQRKQCGSTTTASTTTSNQVEILKKIGKISTNSLPSTSSDLVISSRANGHTTDQELFLGSLARQLNEQTWQKLRSILATLNSQTPSSSAEVVTTVTSTNSQVQSTR